MTSAYSYKLKAALSFAAYHLRKSKLRHHEVKCAQMWWLNLHLFGSQFYHANISVDTAVKRLDALRCPQTMSASMLNPRNSASTMHFFVA